MRTTNKIEKNAYRNEGNTVNVKQLAGVPIRVAPIALRPNLSIGLPLKCKCRGILTYKIFLPDY